MNGNYAPDNYFSRSVKKSHTSLDFVKFFSDFVFGNRGATRHGSNDKDDDAKRRKHSVAGNDG
jgi:hypothetical protein